MIRSGTECNAHRHCRLEGMVISSDCPFFVSIERFTESAGSRFNVPPLLIAKKKRGRSARSDPSYSTLDTRYKHQCRPPGRRFCGEGRQSSGHFGVNFGHQNEQTAFIHPVASWVPKDCVVDVGGASSGLPSPPVLHCQEMAVSD